MKIAFVGGELWEKKAVQKGFPRQNIIFSRQRVPNAKIVSLFVQSPITEQVLDSNPHIKYITTRSTGYDHIDVQACKKRGIVVGNVPAYGEETVAEHTFALILGLSRKLIDAVERTKQGSFLLDGLRGFDLLGKTLGIIGGGRIGQHVARIAQGFGMNVLVFDIRKDPQLARQMKFRYVSLKDLLSQSDIVTIHVPYTSHTHHLINEEKLSFMKQGSYLINTARGGIIDTHALVRALRSGHLAGAGLDVLEEENHLCEEVSLLTPEGIRQCNLQTILEDHILLKMPNVLITPHNAFNTKEALQRIMDTTLHNIKAFMKGKPINVVR